MSDADRELNDLLRRNPDLSLDEGYPPVRRRVIIAPTEPAPAKKKMAKAKQPPLTFGPARQGPITIVLRGERAAGWNQFNYRGDWRKGHKENKRIAALVQGALAEQHPNIGTYPGRVDILIQAWFHGRGKDSSNICAKLYEDALLPGDEDEPERIVVIADDSPKYVRRMITESVPEKVAECRVEITISPVGE